jgi:hypothetical protein
MCGRVKVRARFKCRLKVAVVTTGDHVRGNFDIACATGACAHLVQPLCVTEVLFGGL